MTDRELMKLTLGYMESVGQMDMHPEEWAIAVALRERLAQPEQEPVAWIQQVIEDLHALHDTELIREIESGDALIRLDDAIAAVEEAAQRHTPALRQWQGLTDEEIYDCLQEKNREKPSRLVRQIAKIIETALLEKNNDR